MMGRFKIYISCPIALPDRVLSKYVTAAEKLKAYVSYWRRGTVYCETSTIQNCEAFILILPLEKFKCSINSLPPGCKLELREAQNSKKQIFIGYTTSDGISKFYEADISSGAIGGIAGSSTNLVEAIKAKESKTFSDFIEFLGTNPVKKKSTISPVFITVPRI